MELTEKQVRQLAEDRIMKCYGDGHCDLEAMINLFVDGYSEATRQINLSLGDVSGSADYWSERCKLAETCNEESPCDPDITTEQIEAWSKYHNFIKTKGQNNYR